MKFPDDFSAGRRWVWLSHVLDRATPAYGGGPGLDLVVEKSIDRGDSCNGARLTFSNHLGSHVDAPLHFLSSGRAVEDYAPGDWLFSCPLLIDVPTMEAELITPERLEALSLTGSPDVDLLFIRTGSERYRGQERFWRHGPGLREDLADWFGERFPSLSAIGLDSLSLTSFQHRETGRRAHSAFLGRGLRIFEDLALGNVQANDTLTGVIALPLRFARADGAPCALIGLVG